MLPQDISIFTLSAILFSEAETFVQEGITSNISVKLFLTSTHGPAGDAV